MNSLLTAEQSKSLTRFVSLADAIKQDPEISDAAKSLLVLFDPYVVLALFCLVLDTNPELLSKWRNLND
jgi:hypothetical protein